MKYITPEIEILEINVIDVIQTSGTGGSTGEEEQRPDELPGF